MQPERRMVAIGTAPPLPCRVRDGLVLRSPDRLLFEPVSADEAVARLNTKPPFWVLMLGGDVLRVRPPDELGHDGKLTEQLDRRNDLARAQRREAGERIRELHWCSLIDLVLP